MLHITFCSIYNATPIGQTGTFSNMQLELGSTATAFEAYNGATYSIPIKDTAGTVLSLAPTESIALNLADGKWYIGATELHADTKTAIESVVEVATLTNIFTTIGVTLDTTYRIESTANDGADLYLFGTPLPKFANFRFGRWL